jgi:hypothetical protein
MGTLAACLQHIFPSCAAPWPAHAVAPAGGLRAQARTARGGGEGNDTAWWGRCVCVVQSLPSLPPPPAAARPTRRRGAPSGARLRRDNPAWALRAAPAARPRAVAAAAVRMAITTTAGAAAAAAAGSCARTRRWCLCSSRTAATTCSPSARCSGVRGAARLRSAPPRRRSVGRPATFVATRVPRAAAHRPRGPGGAVALRAPLTGSLRRAGASHAPHAAARRRGWPAYSTRQFFTSNTVFDACRTSQPPLRCARQGA